MDAFNSSDLRINFSDWWQYHIFSPKCQYVYIYFLYCRSFLLCNEELFKKSCYNALIWKLMKDKWKTHYTRMRIIH